MLSSNSTPGYILEKTKTLIWKDTCIPIFTAVLYTRAKMRTQSSDCLKKMWYTHTCELRCTHTHRLTVECHSGVKRKTCFHLQQLGQTHRLFSSVQSLSRVRLFATAWIAACQASLPITNSWSSLRLTSNESVMPSSHLILSSPSPPAPNPSQHQSLFQWVNSSHEVAKVLEFQL